MRRLRSSALARCQSVLFLFLLSHKSSAISPPLGVARKLSIQGRLSANSCRKWTKVHVWISIYFIERHFHNPGVGSSQIVQRVRSLWAPFKANSCNLFNWQLKSGTPVSCENQWYQEVTRIIFVAYSYFLCTCAWTTFWWLSKDFVNKMHLYPHP